MRAHQSCRLDPWAPSFDESKLKPPRPSTSVVAAYAIVVCDRMLPRSAQGRRSAPTDVSAHNLPRERVSAQSLSSPLPARDRMPGPCEPARDRRTAALTANEREPRHRALLCKSRWRPTGQRRAMPRNFLDASIEEAEARGPAASNGRRGDRGARGTGLTIYGSSCFP